MILSRTSRYVGNKLITNNNIVIYTVTFYVNVLGKYSNTFITPRPTLDQFNHDGVII